MENISTREEQTLNSHNVYLYLSTLYTHTWHSVFHRYHHHHKYYLLGSTGRNKQTCSLWQVRLYTTSDGRVGGVLCILRVHMAFPLTFPAQISAKANIRSGGANIVSIRVDRGAPIWPNRSNCHTLFYQNNLSTSMRVKIRKTFICARGVKENVTTITVLCTLIGGTFYSNEFATKADWSALFTHIHVTYLG